MLTAFAHIAVMALLVLLPLALVALLVYYYRRSRS